MACFSTNVRSGIINDELRALQPGTLLQVQLAFNKMSFKFEEPKSRIQEHLDAKAAAAAAAAIEKEKDKAESDDVELVEKFPPEEETACKRLSLPVAMSQTKSNLIL